MATGTTLPATDEGWRSWRNQTLPMFEGLVGHLQRCTGGLEHNFPNQARVQSWLDGRARNHRGEPLQLDSGQDGPLSAAEYERSILDRASLPYRPGWHDLFNAAVWSMFPRAKAALNWAHVQSLACEHQHPRSRRRDALSLLDECGVLLVHADPSLSALHRGHAWRELFVDRRSSWHREIWVWIFGHGLYEQCLLPRRGLTGKALHLPATSEFAALLAAGDEVGQLEWVDVQLAELLPRALKTPRALLPLPILGVPKWHGANVDPSYYDDLWYFRPKRPCSDP